MRSHRAFHCVFVSGLCVAFAAAGVGCANADPRPGSGRGVEASQPIDSDPSSSLSGTVGDGVTCVDIKTAAYEACEAAGLSLVDLEVPEDAWCPDGTATEAAYTCAEPAPAPPGGVLKGECADASTYAAEAAAICSADGAALWTLTLQNNGACASGQFDAAAYACGGGSGEPGGGAGEGESTPGSDPAGCFAEEIGSEGDCVAESVLEAQATASCEAAGRVALGLGYKDSTGSCAAGEFDYAGYSCCEVSGEPGEPSPSP